MADEREQISGKLREDRRSSNTVDQSLMNRSVSGSDEEIPEEDEEENFSQPGEEYADLREQQAKARTDKAAEVAGKVASAYVGGGVQGKIVGKVAEDLVKKQAKNKTKLWLIGSAASCLPGCLMVAGFLAMAAVMLTFLANPMKALGMIFDYVFGAF